MPNNQAMRGVSFTLQDTQTTGNGTTIGIPNSFREHKIIIAGSNGVASGAIQAETAEEFAYAGTWAQIGGGPITVVANAELILSFEGLYKNIRARISTNIVGGTVTVTYQGS